MKKLFLLMLLLATVCLFSNENKQNSDPFTEFYKTQNEKNFLNAFNYYNSLLDENNSNYDAKIKLVYMFSILKDKYLNQLQQNIDSLSIREKFQVANLLLDKGNYEEAIKIYDELNKTVPKWSCPWRHKGEAFYKQKKLKEAEQALKKAIETRKEHYDAYIMLAEVQRDLKKYEEALKTFEIGLSYKGKDIEEPEKEVNSIDEMLLHIQLLKLNNKDYSEILKKFKQIAPNDKRINDFE